MHEQEPWGFEVYPADTPSDDLNTGFGIPQSLVPPNAEPVQEAENLEVPIEDLITKTLEAGNEYPLPNGWSYVRHKQPEGQERQVISDIPFTAYFAKRKIPAAAKGDTYYNHDRVHMRSYPRLVGDPEFANLLHSAAQNALNNEVRSGIFAMTIDNFSDGEGDIAMHGEFLDGVDFVYKNLYNLVALAYLNVEGVTTEAIVEKTEEIWLRFIPEAFQSSTTRQLIISKANTQS